MSAGKDREFIDHLQEKEGGKAMKCPLSRMAAMISYGNIPINEIECEREECAWWSRAISGCSILGLEVSLSLIGALLLKIREEMPHAGQFLQKP